MTLYGQGKLISPDAILAEEPHDKARETLKQTLIELILIENDLAGQVSKEFEKVKPILNEKAKELTKDVTEDMAKKPEESWRDPVLKVAHDLVERSICSNE
jgi:hypothetical protein